MKNFPIKSKESKASFFATGFIVIISMWIIVGAAEVTTYVFLKTVLLITLSYVAMIYDLSTKRIPNALVLSMIFGWLILVIPMVYIDIENGIRILTDSIYGLLIGGGMFLLVYLLSKKGLGGGDVKFMAAAGLYLGFAHTIPAILFGTVLAAIAGLVLILLKKIEKKDRIPLAPFLFIGIMITVFMP